MEISRIRVVLPSGGEHFGKVYLRNQFGTAYKGTADTDLKAGVYEITSVDKPKQKFIIQGARPGQRFYIIPDGVDPWSLSYSQPLLLEVTTDDVVDGGKNNEEMLDGIGKDAYTENRSYIDRVKGGHYNVLTGEFTVDHEDGTTIKLNYKAIIGQVRGSKSGNLALPSGEVLKGGGRERMYVYTRDPISNKILPKFFDFNSAPNIAAMITEIEEARPDAELIMGAVPLMLEAVGFSGFAGATGRAVSSATREVNSEVSTLGAARQSQRAWRLVPKGPASSVRKYLEIYDEVAKDLPSAVIGKQGEVDCLAARVEAKIVKGADGGGKVEVLYHISDMSALGADAGKVKAAHRAMMVSAAEKAKLAGQREFRMVGKQVNQNGRAHFDKMARDIGVPFSGKAGQIAPGHPGFGDYEVTLVVEKVLGTNTP
jgi:hypothetical protein